MKNRNRTSLLAATAALAAALALPAMAQSTSQDAAAQSGSSATAAQSSGASSGGGQTWASVDTDSDGAISKQEAQVNAGLAKIFDQADGNTDGKLTPDEYKAFVAKQQGGGATGSQGN
ncbi:EF-hand domain-containing protein [Xanthomonas citri pv. citri]